MRSPRFVALFLAALALPQAYALIRQVELGFRPLGKAPVRVPLSWDMFSVRIERCSLQWTPPVRTPLGELSRLSDLSPALEWDVVGDKARAYQGWARWGCRHAAGPAKVRLRCFFPDGKEEELGFDCP